MGGSRVADGRRAFEILSGTGFDPGREVLLADGEVKGAGTGFVGSSRILRLTPDRVVLDVRASAPGFVVLADAFDVPTVGRMQPVADNTGAAFVLFKGESEDKAPATGDGAFHWNELTTNDPDKAKTFYEQVLGYTVEAMDMPQGKYYMLKNGDVPRGGMMKSPHDGPPAWVQYVTVDDVDGALTRCKSSGGKSLMGPMDVDGVGRFAVLQDNSGAAIGVITPAK